MHVDMLIDLAPAEKAAREIIRRLQALRERLDLSDFEYCRRVRIAPTAIPFSHPEITLNTFARDDQGLLSTYLHEQMHWYVTWYSHDRPKQWSALMAELTALYPDLTAQQAGTMMFHSAYLHLIVNWLEIEVVSRFYDRALVAGALANGFVYPQLYRLVVEDWDKLAALYLRYGVLPVRAASTMTEEDLALAARLEESAVFHGR